MLILVDYSLDFVLDLCVISSTGTDVLGKKRTPQGPSVAQSKRSREIEEEGTTPRLTGLLVRVFSLTVGDYRRTN